MPKRKRRDVLPKVGTKLKGRYKSKAFEATVVSVQPNSGGVAVDVNGVSYRSLSGAAKAITGHAVNGWRFWGLK